MKKKIQSLSTYIKAHPKIDLIILGFGLAIFIAITLANVSRASIWFDEAFSAYIVQFSFWDIARYTATDVHPPFYYWLLKIWSSMFGTTELAYRSLSILFGAGAISSAFFLTRKLFGRKTAWVSLLFLAISPMLIRYSDEARMYTLASLIVLSATYVLLRAKETQKKSTWIWYGVLVSLGMWTHYFTALAWLAHWAWWATEKYRKNMKIKEFMAAFFTREWLIAYGVAVGLFLPWLPFMALQLGVVQGGGFWIGQVGVDTPANYITNFFYYLEHDQVHSWYALALIVVVVIAVVLTPRTYNALAATQKKLFILVASLAFVPPVLLFFASLPPLRSSFVERYLIPTVVALSIYFAIVFVVGTQKWKLVWRAVPVALVCAMMIVGITNVFTYGNFNKNSNTHILTRQVIEEVRKNATPGVPIIASSPWIFYEAAPYATKEHPVYFIEKDTNYIFGSLDMLKDNDRHKINDLDAFAKENPVIWYLGNTTADDVAPSQDSWQKVKTVNIQDSITGNTIYKATKYIISAE